MLYAGLEVHKNFCQAIVMTKEGKTVKEERIRSEKEAPLRSEPTGQASR